MAIENERGRPNITLHHIYIYTSSSSADIKDDDDLL